MEYLFLMGYLPIRNNSGLIILNNGEGKTRAVKVGSPGSPDIIACSPQGQFIAVECKSSKGKLSRRQSEFLEKINKLGGKAVVVKNIDDLINFLG